jgi:hypothetical protein
MTTNVTPTCATLLVMADSKVRRLARARGSIDVLPSGALRARLYAVQNPLTKQRRMLVEVIPPGPRAQKQAEAVLDRMQRDVTDHRTPRTDATADKLLERYLDHGPVRRTRWSSTAATSATTSRRCSGT